MNILLLASHAVAEYDDLRMLTDLGFDVFAPGGYEVPGAEGEGIRPPLPDAPYHPDFVALCQREREVHGEPGPAIDWAKAHIAPEIIEWADAIIVHHFPDQWIGAQWQRIRHKRVIWRTCGQSDPGLERRMLPFRADGLQIVRYSPAERRYFESVGSFAGQDALIRFGKYPSDYGPWIGDNVVVGNVTQHMKQRGEACGYRFWQAATEGLPVAPAGPGSEEIGGVGSLAYPAMLDYLRHLRAYLYTGTTPASYTLGLIEAMLSGVPVVSIGPEEWKGPDLLFEGHEIVEQTERNGWTHNDAAEIGGTLNLMLKSPDDAALWSTEGRRRAIDLFDVAKVGPQWQAFLL